MSTTVHNYLCPSLPCGTLETVRVEIALEPETEQLTTHVGDELQRCAEHLGTIDDSLLEIKRTLMDLARNYRKALGQGAAIHVADQADRP